MRQTKHTPGPWILETDYIRDSNGDNVICLVGAMGNNADENARLIASAPELLDALADLLQVAETQLLQDASHVGLSNCDLLAKARKAITKATL